MKRVDSETKSGTKFKRGVICPDFVDRPGIQKHMRLSADLVYTKI